MKARLSHSLLVIYFATGIGSLAANYSAVMLLLKLCCKKLHNSSIFWASVNWQIANRFRNIFHILVKRQIAPDASSSWQLRLWSSDLGSNPRQKTPGLPSNALGCWHCTTGKFHQALILAIILASVELKPLLAAFLFLPSSLQLSGNFIIL